MNNRKYILDELSAISPTLAAIPVVNVFSVPDNYFNTLSDNILSSLPVDNNSLFLGLEKQPLSVPEGYFNGLADSILNKIKSQSENTATEEIDYLSPTISNIGNKNIFTVPENYFKNSVSDILNNIPKPAKLVEMKRRSSFLNYASAAVVSGIIGLSVLSVFNNKTDSSNGICQ